MFLMTTVEFYIRKMASENFLCSHIGPIEHLSPSFTSSCTREGDVKGPTYVCKHFLRCNEFIFEAKKKKKILVLWL